MASGKTTGRWPRWLGRLRNRILDPSIVFSFDQSGFHRHAALFEAGDIDVDMTGRVCVVTGANSGIGFATAMALAVRGAEVWMLCRNAARGEAARQMVMDETGSQNIHLLLVDVSDIEQVGDAQRFHAIPRIDVLIHNAGVLLDQRSSSPQGLELTLATHLVGPLALTATLIQKMGSGSRMIWVSSGGMYAQKLNIVNLESPSEPFDGVRAYAQVKRAMVITAEHLAATLEARGISVHCMHPGWASTPGVKTSIPRFYRVTRAILRTSAQGADTIVWLAVSTAVVGQTGGFWFDRRRVTTHMLPTTRTNATARTQLWTAVHQWAEIPEHIWSLDRERRMDEGA